MLPFTPVSAFLLFVAEYNLGVVMGGSVSCRVHLKRRLASATDARLLSGRYFANAQ